MNSVNEWLEHTKAYATLVAEGYRLELSRLWLANVLFVVIPAVLSTAAAIVAALPEAKARDFVIFSLSVPPASAFAGCAAILMAVHKSLKCDEYQAECVRLGQYHKSIAISAASALSRPESERVAHQAQIAKRLEELTESANARLPTRIIRRAEQITGTKLYAQSAV